MNKNIIQFFLRSMIKLFPAKKFLDLESQALKSAIIVKTLGHGVANM